MGRGPKGTRSLLWMLWKCGKCGQVSAEGNGSGTIVSPQELLMGRWLCSRSPWVDTEPFQCVPAQDPSYQQCAEREIFMG